MTKLLDINFARLLKLTVNCQLSKKRGNIEQIISNLNTDYKLAFSRQNVAENYRYFIAIGVLLLFGKQRTISRGSEGEEKERIFKTFG